MKRCFLLCYLFCVLACSAAVADNVRVGIASNFLRPATEVAAAFEAATGHTVLLSAGSTGKLYGQITVGAPYDVFLAADEARPRALLEKGLAVAGSQRTYAIGVLALWSNSRNQAAPLKHLQSARYRRLAIATPALAPYGLAAEQTLQALALDYTVTDRLVFGESVAQAMSFVATGNAELGFIALAQIKALPKERRGRYWVVPAELHTPIKQDAVLLNASNTAAAEFLDFLSTPAATEILTSFGYRLP
ncbi:MAG: molybdate ABC transporter substrate-binding protein [Pseudomonadota bacterium]